MEEYSKEKYKDPIFQQLDSEIIDNESSFMNFEVLTYPADYTLEVLVKKMEENQIQIPHFQRKYVWSMAQASRLIESFMLGLPVPAIFLYTDDKGNLNVIDGQQRLLTIFYFFKGFFGDEINGKKTIFKLIGFKENNLFKDITYDTLKQSNPAILNKLNDSVLRAFIVKQIHPQDNTSIYHIFERLNTGGTLLQCQEIRNCIYYGKFNDSIIRLNQYESWRKIFGNSAPNKHKRDEEMILRFFALYNNYEKYSKPMKDFLSNFLADNRNPSDKKIELWETLFKKTSDNLLKYVGEKPFILTRGLNVAVFDSVFTTIAKHSDKINYNKLKENFKKLINDADFVKAATSATTDEAAIDIRFKRCNAILLEK